MGTENVAMVQTGGYSLQQRGCSNPEAIFISISQGEKGNPNYTKGVKGQKGEKGQPGVVGALAASVASAFSSGKLLPRYLMENQTKVPFMTEVSH